MRNKSYTKSAFSGNEISRGYNRILSIAYCVTAFAMLLIIILNLALKSQKEENIGIGSVSEIGEMFTDKNGEKFDIANIDGYYDENEPYISAFLKLVNTGNTDKTMVFRSKNSYVTVLINGIEVYRTDVTDAPFYNNSPGTRWNFVNITPADSGKTLEVRVEQAYNDGRAKIDNFRMGDRGAIVADIIEQKAFGLLVSVMIFLVGIIFLSACFILNWKRNVRDYSLLWLAVFAIVCSIWCLLETNVFQLFSNNLRLIQVVDNMMLVIGGLPLYFYMDCTYGIFRYRIPRILTSLDALYVITAVVLQFTGVLDFHQTLNGAVINYAIIVALFIICLVKKSRNIGKYVQKGERFFVTMQQIGIAMLAAGLLGDLLRYLLSDVLDRAMLIRMGLLLFIICYGSGNIYQMIILVKKGIEADFISKLAYKDGLTDVGNRTAYIEHIQKLTGRKTGNGLLFVMFDINNLKTVNDTLGHQIGDELICESAELIAATYGKFGSIYRIGGDEFTAIIDSENIHELSAELSESFKNAMNEKNALTGREFTVSVASGCSFCESNDSESIEASLRFADKEMYKNKFRMKMKEVREQEQNS